MANAQDICKKLRKNYQVNEFFYPDISMDIDLPAGLEGEVKKVMNVLDKARFPTSVENVLRVMQMKKELLKFYKSKPKEKAVLEDFSKLITEHVKPIGATIPLDLLFVGGLTFLLLLLANRFVGSFLDEAGKILARKILTRDKKELSEELGSTELEYEFLEKHAIELIQDEEKMKVFLRYMKSIARTKKREEV